MTNTQNQNPLGVLPEKELLRQFAIPSVIAMLVGSLYNIVDQFFIGQKVGELGNAATNIAFPLSISCIAIALMFGIGGASAFNLSMGRGESHTASLYIGNAFSNMFLWGTVLAIISLLFLEPLLLFFGSPDAVLPYALTYSRITACGFPFMIISAGGGHLVRADGSPRIAMFVNLIGAIINIVFDALFVFVLDWGMAGAAYATVLGQFISTIFVALYLAHYKTVKLSFTDFIPQKDATMKDISLGTAPCFNQLSLMLVQIVMNRTLKKYGANSIYGESIPIACAGIITKVSQLVMAFIIGISQGLQPIVSFNYGAAKYQRVKNAYTLALKRGFVISVSSFILFQLFPRQIISIFGEGSAEYFQFAIKYFHVFLFFIFLCFIQPITSNFFTAIGKPRKGIFLSLTRQCIFLVPLLILLPIWFGIDGVMYAGPIADFTAALVCILMVIHELKKEEYHRK